ncbi:B-cell antigen receptor complex-associated protein beta chain [Perognathus longimembris pacificus]|uniref:B-cell antigen receptor complex-associated protein beta chain n=1 Tax=Perognathus longimembris pacificus TaxID=214514 RepID=UPI0020186088|nr:B-cell antigen receptor complex-associated protein beta chain [Perognathus longimembris pacificus]
MFFPPHKTSDRGPGDRLGLDSAVTMARLGPAPRLQHWLLLVLLLSDEPVPAMSTRDRIQNPSGSACSRIWQHPRFVARKRGSVVKMYCHADGSSISDVVTWFRKPEMNMDPQIVLPEQDRIKMSPNGSIHILTIQGVQFEDNGIYFCKQECTRGSSTREFLGCGTELRVMGFSTLAQLKRRNTLKDGIIMIQTLLIILFIIVPIFLLLDKDESKPGMEEDHTYEGLNVDQTATYEDIVTLRTGEVKWSVGEHPGQE